MPPDVFTEVRIGAEITADGHLQLSDKASARDLIRRCPPGPVILTLRPAHRKKTLDQLAYWFAVPVPLIADHCGYSHTQMHYALLGECFGYSPGPMGKPIPNVPSIAECSVKQVSHLIEWVLTWAPTELGVIVPEPDPTWRSQKGTVRHESQV